MLVASFLSLSCEKKEEVGDARDRVSSDSLEAVNERESFSDRSKRRKSTARQKMETMIGETLHAGDDAGYDQWVKRLSRNENEQAYRKQQLVHMLRTEVLDWGISDQDLESAKNSDEPISVELPFFENETLEVVVNEVRRFGSKSINVKGYLAGDPESKVHISLTNQSPTATIIGPNTLYYYEAFEDVVILREDSPGSQNADFDCNCERHQTAESN